MKFTLPLMMYGINGYEWHRKGEHVLHRPIIGEDTIKSGNNKGKARKVRSKEWLLKTRKRKTLIGYDEENPYKSGKNKGKPRKLFEDKFFPIESTGYFPTVNHIYMQIGGGASRRLKPIAEEKLMEWKEIAMAEAKEVGYISMDKPQFVVVDLEFYLPTNGAGDTHNAKKLLLDALEGVVHNNDFYMLDRTNKVQFDDENPRIEVSVLAYEGRT
jgi:hypothetical protein